MSMSVQGVSKKEMTKGNVDEMMGLDEYTCTQYRNKVLCEDKFWRRPLQACFRGGGDVHTFYIKMLAQRNLVQSEGVQTWENG